MRQLRPIPRVTPPGKATPGPHESRDDATPWTTPSDRTFDRQMQRLNERRAPVFLNPRLVQRMQSVVGNRQLTRWIQREEGKEGAEATKPNNYNLGDVLKDGNTYYRVTNSDEQDAESKFWEYTVEDLSGQETVMSLSNLQEMEFKGNQTGEYWEGLKQGKTESVAQIRDASVFHDWEQGESSQPGRDEVDQQYWEEKQSGVESKHTRQFLSAQESRRTELSDGGTAQVQSGVDYLSSKGGGNFLKRVGGFAFSYTNPSGRDTNLKWLQFLTISVAKGENAEEQTEVPRSEDEPATRVDNNSPAYPYYDPGRQSDTEIMMFDDPMPNVGTFIRLIQDGAKFVTEVDTFDTFLVRQADETQESKGGEPTEQPLFHAVIKVTFTCDASGEPTTDGFPIKKKSEIVSQEQATAFPKMQSETLRAWYGSKKL